MIALGNRTPPAPTDDTPPRTLTSDALVEHLDRLYRAAWGLCGSREDAEDLVQETCARVLRKPRVLRSGGELSYLLRALRNTYFSTRRSAGRHPRVVATLDDVDTADPRTDTRPDQALSSREVYSAIADLPEPFRLTVVAVDLIGLSYREAARALRTREATITTRLYRGRQRLALALDAVDAAPRTGHDATAHTPTRRSGATAAASPPFRCG